MNIFNGLSNNTSLELKSIIYSGISSTLDKEYLSKSEKEELVKWYEKNIIISSKYLIKKLTNL